MIIELFRPTSFLEPLRQIYLNLVKLIRKCMKRGFLIVKNLRNLFQKRDTYGKGGKVRASASETPFTGKLVYNGTVLNCKNRDTGN